MNDTNISPDGPRLPMDPDVWIEIEQDSYIMKVEPGNAEPINVRGWVHCDTPAGYPPGTDIFVDVDILGSPYYTGLLQFEFDKSKDVKEFEIEIPPMIDAFVDQDLYVRFFTSWYTYTPDRTGEGGGDEARIYPVPFGSVHIQDMKEPKFDVGERYDLVFTVENNGNCDAHISMNLDVDGDLEVAYPDLHFVVEAKNFGHYPYILHQKSGTGKTGKLTVTATSNVSGLLQSSTLVLRYHTEGRVQKLLKDPPALVISLGSFILVLAVISSILWLIRKRRRSIAKG